MTYKEYKANRLIAYNAKSRTRVATISINPNKAKVIGAATTSINPKDTFRDNASVEDHDN